MTLVIKYDQASDILQAWQFPEREVFICMCYREGRAPVAASQGKSTILPAICWKAAETPEMALLGTFPVPALSCAWCPDASDIKQLFAEYTSRRC